MQFSPAASTEICGKWNWIEGEVTGERASLTRVPHLLGTLPLIHWRPLILSFDPWLLEWTKSSKYRRQNSRCECITYGPSLTSIIYTSASGAYFHFCLSMSYLHLLSPTLPLLGVVVLHVRMVYFICIWKGDLYLPPLSVMRHLIYFARCGWLTLLVTLVLSRAQMLTQHLQ